MSCTLAVKEISVPGATSSSHLPLPPQEKAMPAPGFISHQVNKWKWPNSPQPIYLHLPEGSDHLFLSSVPASQEHIRRFSLEHAPDCSWKTKPGTPERL